MYCSSLDISKAENGVTTYVCLSVRPLHPSSNKTRQNVTSAFPLSRVVVDCK